RILSSTKPRRAASATEMRGNARWKGERRDGSASNGLPLGGPFEIRQHGSQDIDGEVRVASAVPLFIANVADAGERTRRGRGARRVLAQSIVRIPEGPFARVVFQHVFPY